MYWDGSISDRYYPEGVGVRGSTLIAVLITKVYFEFFSLMFLSFPDGLARHPFAMGNVASKSIFIKIFFQTKFHAYQIQVIQDKGSNC